MSLCSQIHRELHLAILGLLQRHVHGQEGGTLLDVGCWDGVGTVANGEKVAATRLLGVEGFSSLAEVAERKGVEVAVLDLEKERFPRAKGSVDVVVCNQVFEHLKDVFLPLDEIARVLRPGGWLIISVPNLGSLHNRIMLGLGFQPTFIRVYGPHVRGFARREFEAFLTIGKVFKIRQAKGVGFHPLPPAFGGNVLAGIWIDACHTPIWVCERTAEDSFSLQGAYRSRAEQTLM